jgi:RNA polymerase sigma-70 factor, ECF subfamily
MTPAMGDVESRIQELSKAGAHDQAATLVLETYGSEVFGYLVHTLGNESDAGEVFSQTAEDLWKGLPSFGFRCTVRTWIYVLGRHAISRYRRSPWNRGERRTGDSRLDSAVQVARSRTQPWRRTEVKDRMAALRDSLDEDDRTLLTLRVDRDLGWEDIARVMLGGEEPDAKDVARESARLRKRFQLLKDELRRRAQEAGLLEQR